MRDERTTISEDRATQPMEAGGWVSQLNVWAPIPVGLPAFPLGAAASSSGALQAQEWAEGEPGEGARAASATPMLRRESTKGNGKALYSIGVFEQLSDVQNPTDICICFREFGIRSKNLKKWQKQVKIGAASPTSYKLLPEAWSFSSGCPDRCHNWRLSDPRQHSHVCPDPAEHNNS